MPWPGLLDALLSTLTVENKEIFKGFPHLSGVSARRRDYDKLTREVSKGLLPTAPPSYSEAIKGSEANRESGVFGSVAEAVGRVVFVFFRIWVVENR